MRRGSAFGVGGGDLRRLDPAISGRRRPIGSIDGGTRVAAVQVRGRGCGVDLGSVSIDVLRESENSGVAGRVFFFREATLLE